MGAFSIWHWIIVLGVLLTPLLPIFLASADKRLTRGEYAIRTLCAVGVGILLNLIGSASVILALPALVITIILYVLTVSWTVHRLQDVGASRWVALLFILPFIGFIVWIALMFVPTKGESASSGRNISAP